MTKPLDGVRVRELRTQRGLSRARLARQAKMSKESVYRLEKGAQPGTRQKTRDALADALAVAPGVLTGELPMPAAEPPVIETAEMYPLNYRVDGAIRNAFTLASWRYQIPIARLIELAPALFVLAAEGSLQRRQEKLSALEEDRRQAENRARDFLHLPAGLFAHWRGDEVAEAEQDSIDRRDILAATLPDDIYDSPPVQHSYDAAEHNPFVVALREAAERLGAPAVVERFTRHGTDFHVCRADVLTLTGGDEDLADYILHGHIVLKEMPQGLLPEAATEARVAWLREQQRAYDAAPHSLLDL